MRHELLPGAAALAPGIVLDAVAQLEPIAQDLGLTQAQLSLAWVLSNENVASAIIGASRPEQVVSNAEASGVVLERDVLDRIEGIFEGLAETDPSKTQLPAGREA